MLGINLGHHYLPTYQILMISGNVEFLPPIYRVLAAILKMADISQILKTQNCSSNGDLSLCQSLCLYHYSYGKWAVKIQHCPISSKFDMWVDNDVPN
jgi:hypothetical protein